MLDDKITIYGCRKKSEIAPVNAAAALAAGRLAQLTCSSCSAECLGFKPMHDEATKRAAAEGRTLRVMCFACVEAAGKFREPPVGTMAAMTLRAPDGSEITIAVPGDGGRGGPDGVGRA